MPLKFAMVCASNMNRSMEAHRLAIEAGLCVRSFGVGQHVKLPGASANSPNVYDFGTTYEHIYKDLKQKDQALYTRNGKYAHSYIARACFRARAPQCELALHS